MIFHTPPQFITDEAGNRIKVILEIEDFYALLAKAQEDTPTEEVTGEVLSGTEFAERMLGLAEEPAPATTDGAEALHMETRRTQDDIFRKAFELVKNRNS